MNLISRNSSDFSATIDKQISLKRSEQNIFEDTKSKSKNQFGTKNIYKIYEYKQQRCKDASKYFGLSLTSILTEQHKYAQICELLAIKYSSLII